MSSTVPVWLVPLGIAILLLALGVLSFGLYKNRNQRKAELRERLVIKDEVIPITTSLQGLSYGTKQ